MKDANCKPTIKNPKRYEFDLKDAEDVLCRTHKETFIPMPQLIRDAIKNYCPRLIKETKAMRGKLKQ